MTVYIVYNSAHDETSVCAIFDNEVAATDYAVARTEKGSQYDSFWVDTEIIYSSADEALSQDKMRGWMR